jgi:hypothetical protein
MLEVHSFVGSFLYINILSTPKKRTEDEERTREVKEKQHEYLNTKTTQIQGQLSSPNKSQPRSKQDMNFAICNTPSLIRHQILKINVKAKPAAKPG